MTELQSAEREAGGGEATAVPPARSRGSWQRACVPSPATLSAAARTPPHRPGGGHHRAGLCGVPGRTYRGVLRGLSQQEKVK